MSDAEVNRFTDDFPQTDRFEKVRLIGAGGMGVVYEAFDRKHQTPVALKTMRDSHRIASLKDEFRALADISHPNLVEFHELFSAGGRWFFTMELVDGVTFLDYARPSQAAGRSAATPGNLWKFAASFGADRERFDAAAEGWGNEETRLAPVDRVDPELARPGVRSRLHHVGRTATGALATPLDLDRLRATLPQVALGLTALHQAGKLHRDIKPSNVLVEPSGRVVILDLGLARELRERAFQIGRDVERSGTLGYMAPEQVAAEDLAEATDWYCLGAMLYEVLTGRLPFEGEAFDVVHAKTHEDPQPPRDLNPVVPEDLESLCLQLLQRKPERRPTATEVLRVLGEPPTIARGVSPPTGDSGRTGFVGRESQLAALDEAFLAAQGDRTVGVFVHGTAGTGKTRLVEHFLEGLVARESVLVLSGRCYERESVPYKALDAVIDVLSRHLARLPSRVVRKVLPHDTPLLAHVFPVLRRIGTVADAPHAEFATLDRQDLRRRVAHALRSLVVTLGQQQRLVIHIDDLQWGDRDSALLLSEVLRPPDSPRMLLIGTYRREDADRSPCLQELLKLPAETAGVDFRELPVEALEPGDAVQLALKLLGDEAPTRARVQARTVAQEAGGSPFFIRELVEAQLTGAVLDTKTGSAALDQVVYRRYARLPPVAQRLLEVIAVSGQPLTEEDAFSAAGLQVRDPTILGILRKHHFVRSGGVDQRLEAYHDVIRESVVGYLSEANLKRCHHRLATTLELSREAGPESIAVHFEGAGELGTASEYYYKAADEATQSLAFNRAARLYRRSLELGPPTGSSLRLARIKLGDALANGGRGSEAAAEYEGASDGAGSAEALDLLRQAAYQYCISGHMRKGRETLAAVLQDVSLKLPPTPRHALWPLFRDRIRLRLRGLRWRERDVPQSDLVRLDIVWVTATGLAQVDLVTAAAFQARHLLLALEAGEPRRLARALAMAAMSYVAEGTSQHGRAVELLRMARTLAEREAEPHALGLVLIVEGLIAHMSARWEDCRTSLAEAETILRQQCTGMIWELATVHAHRTWNLVLQGQFAEMRANGGLVLAEARQRGDVHTLTTIGTVVEPLGRLMDDDPDGSRRALSEMAARRQSTGSSLQQIMEFMQSALIELYCRNGDAAWTRVSQYWPTLQKSHLLRLERIRDLMYAIRAYCALTAARCQNGNNRLVRLAERDAERVGREGLPWSQPQARLIRASIAAVRGDRTGAISLLDAAATQLEALGCRAAATPARRHQGRLMGDERGRDLIAEADAWAKREGIQNPARWADLQIAGFE